VYAKCRSGLKIGINENWKIIGLVYFRLNNYIILRFEDDANALLHYL